MLWGWGVGCSVGAFVATSGTSFSIPQEGAWRSGYSTRVAPCISMSFELMPLQPAHAYNSTPLKFIEDHCFSNKTTAGRHVFETEFSLAQTKNANTFPSASCFGTPVHLGQNDMPVDESCDQNY